MANTPPRDNDFTKSEDLMGSLTYGIRKLYLAGSWKEIVVGVTLDESDDSVLLGLPVVLSVENDVPVLRAIDSLPFIRFIKTDIRAVSFAEGMLLDMYLQYLVTNSPKVFPELLEIIGEIERIEPEGHKDSMDENMHADMANLSIKNALNDQDDDLDIQPDILLEGVLIQGTMTDSEVRNAVEKAIQEGCFIIAAGKVPN